MADHIYQFNVTMTCGGCSGAVNRVLGKLDGVKDVKIDMDAQSVRVVAAPELGYQTVYDKIAGTGKKVNSGEEVAA